MFHMDCFTGPDIDGHHFAFLAASETTWEVTFEAAVCWCQETFGPSSEPSGSRWYPGSTTIWFRDVVDATHFRLRWG